MSRVNWAEYEALGVRELSPASTTGSSTNVRQTQHIVSYNEWILEEIKELSKPSKKPRKARGKKVA